MHLVHFNTRYSDPNEAGLHPDGFAVLGTFFDDVDDDEYNNLELNKIVLQLREISEFNTTVDMKRSINLRELLPKDIDTFYTYQGSLTTPPCSEIITWVIFPEAQKIGPQQLFNFERALDTYSDQGSKEVLSETCRDLQPLNDRIVYSSSNSHCSGSAVRPATSLVLENLPASIVSSFSGNRGQSNNRPTQGPNSREYNNNNNYRPNGGGNYMVNSDNRGQSGQQQQQQSDRYYYQNSNGQQQQQSGQGQIDRSPGRGGRVEIVYRNPTVSRRPGLVGGLVGGLLG